jgi:hypothetical protein
MKFKIVTPIKLKRNLNLYLSLSKLKKFMPGYPGKL